MRRVDARAEPLNRPAGPPPARPHHDVVAVEDGRLPRREAGERLAQTDLEPGTTTLEGRDGHRRRAVAQLHLKPAAVAQPAVDDVAHVDGADLEPLAAADDDLVAGGAALEHVERLGGADTDPSPLAHGEAPVPLVAAHDGALGVDDVTGERLHAAALEEGWYPSTAKQTSWLSGSSATSRPASAAAARASALVSPPSGNSRRAST